MRELHSRWRNSYIVFSLICSVIAPECGKAALTSAERDKIAALAHTRPSIDLEVPFDYRSAAITRKSLQQLTTLGEALVSSDLNGVTFIIAGHVSPEGPERYNQLVSERRAEAIKRFLVENFDISPEHLIVIGYGSNQLKNVEDPFASENNRVQIVNLG